MRKILICFLNILSLCYNTSVFFHGPLLLNNITLVFLQNELLVNLHMSLNSTKINSSKGELTSTYQWKALSCAYINIACLKTPNKHLDKLCSRCPKWIHHGQSWKVKDNGLVFTTVHEHQRFLFSFSYPLSKMSTTTQVLDLRGGSQPSRQQM